MPAVPVNGVVELALEYPDVEAAESFYSGVLGFPVVERWSGKGPQGQAVWVMAGDRSAGTRRGRPVSGSPCRGSRIAASASVLKGRTSHVRRRCPDD
jgi:catechol 2,3-dioxygenase-like lactoylglutathione lyase family enzyme